MRPAALLALATLALSASAGAGERRIPFWPDAVPEAIHAQVDGVAALETVRALGRFHRVQGSPGYAAAAEYVRARAEAAGLQAQVEHFPADGEKRYAHFRSYLGWTAESATLEEVSPRPQPIARFPDLPVALADYSQDADVTAELVDVGLGTRAADYDGKELAGRIVLASGPLPAVHALCCEGRGAKGFLSDFPNQTTAWSGDDRDQVRWGHLSPYQVKNTFAFMLSKRQAQALRERLATRERITLHAQVRARMVPATYDVVNAVIPGTDASAGEVVLTAHLCHQSAGANDNASGSAAILEVARALKAAIDRGALPRPRRTIRFLWVPEIAGSQVWLASHPEIAARLVAGVHMDMVGGLLSTTRGTFHLSRSAASLPHVVNPIAAAFLDEVTAASAAYAERGGDPYRGFAWLPGSREAFLGDMRDLELGSDHQVFEDSSFGVPMAYFHDYPDVTIHTSADQPGNLDATKLGRVAYMGAGIAWTLAALPDAEGSRLLQTAEAYAVSRRAQAERRRAALDDPRDGVLALHEASVEGAETIRSAARLWPALAPAAAASVARLPAAPPVPPLTGDTRIPIRAPEVRGPIDVYYYNHLAEIEREKPAPAAPELDERLQFEALNLADGHRTVAGIRDVLTGRYGPVPPAEIIAWFERLQRAGVVRWR